MNFFAKTLFWYIHVDRCLCCENNYLTNKCVYFDCSMTDDNVLYTGRLHKCVWYCQGRTNLKVAILCFQLIRNEIIFDFYRWNREKHIVNHLIEQKYYIFLSIKFVLVIWFENHSLFGYIFIPSLKKYPLKRY